MALNPITGVEIIALMDNVADPFTMTHPGMRWNESHYQGEVLGQKTFCGADACRACNGLSLFLRIHTATDTHHLLFDCGPDEDLVVDNAKRLGVNLTDIDGIVISHGHYDHYGGILSVLDHVSADMLPVYTHPEMFAPLAFNEGEMVTCTDLMANELIVKHGGQVIASRDVIPLFDEHLFVSGEVPRVTAYETGSPGECRLIDNTWESRPDVIDERIIILNLQDKGLCVFTACGHTGVVNAVRHAMDITGIDKVHMVMGGFHLAPPNTADRIEPTIADLQAINPDYIITGHCTGFKMAARLSEVFGDRHTPYGVGTVFKIMS